MIDYWRMNTFDILKGAGSGFLWDKVGKMVSSSSLFFQTHLQQKNKLRATSEDQKGFITFGDVIVSLDSKKVESTEDFYRLLDKYKSGDTVTLEIRRGEKSEKVDIELK
ncbi:PDZ domain-containing protein [Sulfurovum sp.]|uniref:PDZ domain-containing protein n=1 Tax=Sulfurovum sp. TaxID=1969726 RepID=UPI002867DEC6|nr:PDZ domain-containing protein [Sulfurovum sp.]